MNTMQTSKGRPAGFELRFQSLFHDGRGFAFPCDQDGHVDMDSLSQSLRINYLFARTLIGRDFAMPAVTGRTVQ